MGVRPFLDAALASGFEPRVDPGFVFYEATSAERRGTIIRRIPRLDVWEVVLTRPHAPPGMSGFVRGADVAASFVLRWLGGEDEHALWTAFTAVATRRWRDGEFVGAGEPLPGE